MTRVLIGNENFTLLKDSEIIREGYNISEVFNDHYVNIIENITGKKQEELKSPILMT